ncbi:MAG: hypothetical protein CSB24_02455 [Deltaproteobacteria bacterium]|nr:MAG: hypothetical protein CSB24_02455 [Deltaproteobacteria bacterium]
MALFHSLQVGEQEISPIDWEMNPSLTFGTFESWGGRERVRNNDEMVYYFFIDNWGKKPRLRLMERAVKHARVVATIEAPPTMIEQCVRNQGEAAIFERSYAIDDEIKQWLIENVLNRENPPKVIPVDNRQFIEDMGEPLPLLAEITGKIEKVGLPDEVKIINDDQIEGVIKKYNFYDHDLNPEGRFDNVLADNGDGLTVTDLKTGLMWQCKGLDICSIRSMKREIQALNQKGFAGFNDWRLPSMEEAMSLMEPEQNNKKMYLHPCFTKEQAFIFVSAERQPGGYWFVDFKQGRAFWSSGTIPGGFGRLCRAVG